MSAIGGENVTTTIEGRARFPVNVRYPRDLRDDLETLGRVLVMTPSGAQVPLAQVADIRTVTGPSMIRNENGLLVGLRLRRHHGPRRGRLRGGREARGRGRGEAARPATPSSGAASTRTCSASRERLKLVVPFTLFLILFLLYANTKSAGEDADRRPRRAVLAGRRGVAPLGPRLQRLDRGVGRHDRPHGPRRRDRRLHAALPRPRLRRGEGEGAAALDRRPPRGDHPRRGEAHAPEDDDGARRHGRPHADHVVDRAPAPT